MKLRIECAITNSESFSVGAGVYEFNNLYESGPVTMFWHDSVLRFEKDMDISNDAMNAIASANIAMGDDTSQDAVIKWLASVYKGSIKKELYTKFKSFMPIVKRLCKELRCVFNASADSFMVVDRVFIIDDSGLMYTTHAPLQGSGSVTATLKVNNQHLSEFVNGINAFNSHLYAFTVLDNASRQQDLHLQVVELAIAAELGIKEFYSRKLPDLEKMLASMPAPPIAQMYGSMFESYFSVKFKHAKALEKLIQKRNDVAHSTRRAKLTVDDLVGHFKVVQESLCILQTMLVATESEMMRNLSDIGMIENQWPNTAFPKLTNTQIDKIRSNLAFASAKIPIISVFSTAD
jgi:hypothetical protein